VPPAVQTAVAASTPAQPGSQPLTQSLLPSQSSLQPALDFAAAVDYVQGQLSVVSQNAPLGFVLKLVGSKTGAIVDLAPELQGEPVIAQLGPGSVREVLTGLLDSSRIDYIVMGKGNDPDGVQRIVVRTRQAFARTAMAEVRQSQLRQEPTEAETKPDYNGHLVNGPTPAEAKMTQEQLMENWKKSREQLRQAEIIQQQRDRENEKTQSQSESPSQPEPEPQPDNPPPS
jgi:hypothetical protein